VVAGALGLGDAVRGVRERGRLMQEAVPVGTGAMAAVMGLEAEAVERLCFEAAGGEILAPANLNGAGQVVVAGTRGAVERLVALAKAARGKAQLLAVSAPFHCALMAPAAAGLERFLAGVAIRPPAMPVCTSVEGRLVTGADDIRRLLARQVTAPVRWGATMELLRGTPARLAAEFGTGRILSGLWKRTVETIPVLPVGDVAATGALAEALA
jgi:[acyl-carrier-protein] S-malonyltransferase